MDVDHAEHWYAAGTAIPIEISLAACGATYGGVWTFDRDVRVTYDGDSTWTFVATDSRDTVLIDVSGTAENCDFDFNGSLLEGPLRITFGKRRPAP